MKDATKSLVKTILVRGKIHYVLYYLWNKKVLNVFQKYVSLRNDTIDI